MSVADRWEGMSAGECACGAPLIWMKCDGQWAAVHADVRADAKCVTSTEAASAR
jgi:hypothetical protein